MDVPKVQKLGVFYKQIVGTDIDLNKFDDRMSLQKLGYFLQKLGVINGFHFSWYIRGPYCSLLTNEAFSNENLLHTENETTLKEGDVSVLKFLESHYKDIMKDPRSLELHMSLLYLIVDEKIRNDDEVVEKLTTLKPFFSVPPRSSIPYM